MAAILRILVLAAISFGGYKLYPRFEPEIKQVLQNPQVLGTEVATPLINTLNQILPDNINIPTPKPSSSPTNSSPAAEQDPAPRDNLTNTIINEVKQKAGEIAQEQIEVVKKEAGKAFCQVLIEKIKTECGQ